jgi:hypothetical protein
MTQLIGSVQSPNQASKGFDSDTTLSAATAAAFFNDGYQFCVRYLSLGAERSSDLSHDEAAAILGAGLALMPVQHVCTPGWQPSAALGQEYGKAAASDALGVGLPAGVNLWCDLEGIAAGADLAGAVTLYCQAWYAAVLDAGYVPGLYVGANCLLSSEQLELLPFQHYWKSESTVPTVATRGFQMVQTPGSTAHGIGYDLDATQADALGGQVRWLAPAP